MKTAWLGRVVFGASAILFGVIALLWHDANTWQQLTQLWSLPFGSIVGAVLMVAQIAGGLLLLLPMTARFASTVLVIVYGIFTLASIPSAVTSPFGDGAWDGIFEQLSLLCGATAVYIATDADPLRKALLGRLIRYGLALSTVSFTLAQIVFFQNTVDLVPKWIPPNQTFWAVLTTIAFGLAALAMLVNVRAKLSMRLMGAMTVAFGVLVWIPHLVAHPGSHFSWSEFTLTWLITGAAWLVAAS
ncbi:MAG TPA: hypothetical protein VEJ20_05490 [Candidatus Eremiobacteraceae bacterium]|nr:hypothetical protein [Candidatus Eremiobacteraceae bacterium]